MKMLAFASRNTKEILRDKLNLMFGIGFPVIVMLLLSFIQSNVPVALFEIDQLAPGIAVFGLSFISLFSGMLIAKDRTSSFILRLFTSPMSSSDFILGYTLPLVPMAMMQVLACFVVALFLGLELSINLLWTILLLIPCAVIFIALGLLCGTLLNDKQVGGVCGALLTNLSAWLSGIWFDLDLVGGAFKKFANLLPFSHSVNYARAAAAGQFDQLFPDLWWVIGYAVVLLGLAIWVFQRKMNGDK